MSFEAESNSELTVIVTSVAFPISGAKQNTQTIFFGRNPDLGSIAGPCDFLPARSDEFQKVCWLVCKTPIVKVDRNKNATLNRCP